MALDYLRQNTVPGVGDEVSVASPQKKPPRKFSKGKFSLLLSSNVVVWIIFGVSFLDINVFSMNTIPIPKIQRKLAVTGIVYNEKSPSAIISNQVYGIGDIVDGYTISRISRTEVEFDKNGKIVIRQAR